LAINESSEGFLLQGSVSNQPVIFFLFMDFIGPHHNIQNLRFEFFSNNGSFEFKTSRVGIVHYFHSPYEAVLNRVGSTLLWISDSGVDVRSYFLNRSLCFDA